MALTVTTQLPITLAQDPLPPAPQSDDVKALHGHIAEMHRYLKRQKLMLDSLYNKVRQNFALMNMVGLAADRPAAGSPGRTFLATDTNAFSIDTGSTWSGGSGTMSLTTLAITASPYTAALSNSNWKEFRVSTGAGTDFVFNLPAASGTGDVAIIKKMDANAHNVVITPSGADAIDGQASYSLTTQFSAIGIVDAATGVWDVFIVKP